MSINLQGLIDQVLEMVKSSNSGGQSGNSWYGGNKDEEEYWKAIRARNTALEVGKQGNEADIEKQRISDTGALARQGLVNEGNTNVAGINAGAHKYAADQTLEGTKQTALGHLFGTQYTADQQLAGTGKSLLAEQIKGASAVLSDMNASDEDKIAARKSLFSLINNGGGKSTNASPADDISPRRSFDDNNDLLLPTATTTPALPTVKTPARQALITPAPAPTATEEPEQLSLMGKRGFGFLRTKKEIAENLPKEQAIMAADAAAANKFYSPEEQEKRRKRLNFNY